MSTGIHCLEVIKRPEREGGFSETRKIGTVLDVKVCLHQGRYGIEILIESLFRDGNSFLGSNCERNSQLRNRNVRIHFF